MNRQLRLPLGIVFTVFVMMLVLLPAVTATATTGTMLIATDTVLTEDHHGPIVITADNTTLNCAGFSVIGTGEEDGILLVDRTQVTVRDCDVSGFEIGVHLLNSSRNTLTRNTAYDNSAGFQIDENSNRNIVRRNATFNTYVGFVAVGNSDRNWFVRNSSHDNEYGFLIAEESEGNKLIRNRATDNVIGFGAYGNSPGTLLVRNRLCNTDVNLDYEDDSEPRLIRNQICDIGESG